MAEANESAQERNEQPTQKRLDEARRKGQVARSRDLTTSVVLLTSAGALLVLGPFMIERLGALMRASFTFVPPADGASRVWIAGALLGAIRQGLLLAAPLLLATLVAALLAPALLGGWTLSAEAFSFKWDRLDPVRGFGRMFSVQALVEMLKALGKFLVVLVVASALLWKWAGAILGTVDQTPAAGLAHLAWLVGDGFLIIASATGLIALADAPFQLWNHHKQLRMSRQELKDEMRETEGKPEVRSKIRDLQRRLARGRMLESVPSADVIVTNPQHFAVALQWDPAAMQAPKVVASGLGPIAARIREVAAGAGVAVLRAPPLARALYHSTEVGQEIPAGLYVAVAAVLAWVFRMRDPAQGAGAPPGEDELPIPEELRR